MYGLRRNAGRRSRSDEYEETMHRALAGKPLFKCDAEHLTREELHDRARARAEANAARETPNP